MPAAGGHAQRSARVNRRATGASNRPTRQIQQRGGPRVTAASHLRQRAHQTGQRPAAAAASQQWTAATAASGRGPQNRWWEQGDLAVTPAQITSTREGAGQERVDVTPWTYTDQWAAQGWASQRRRREGQRQTPDWGFEGSGLF